MKHRRNAGGDSLLPALERAGRLVALLQVSLVPLAVSPIHQAPYVLPKQALGVWIALAVLLPLLVARGILKKEWPKDVLGFRLPALLLGAWMAFCALFSLSLHDALQLLLLYASAWVTWQACAELFDTPRSRGLAVGALIAGGVAAGAMVWIQAARGIALPHGVFGNKNFQAQHLLLPFGLCLPLTLNQLLPSVKRSKWKIASAALLVFLTATLIRLQSMGAMLGMILAAFGICLAFQWNGRLRLALTRTQATLLMLFLLLLAAGIAIRLFTPGSDLKSKAAQLLSEDSARVRLLIWKGSWPMIVDHWFHGVGPGNFGQVYPLYRLESEMQVFGKATTVSHAHNCYVEWTAELGFVGLALLLWLVHRITARLMEVLTGEGNQGWLLAAGVLAALVATDGQSFFSSNIYQAGPVLGLGFLLGLAEAAMRDRSQYGLSPTSGGTPELRDRLSPSRSITALGSGLTLSLAATFLLMGPVFRTSIADILVRGAIHDKNAGQWDAAADRFEEACQTDPYSFDAPYYRTLLALEQGRPRTALEFANRAIDLQPHHYMALFYRGLALEKSGETAEAAENYRQVLRLVPPYHPAREGLGRLGIPFES